MATSLALIVLIGLLADAAFKRLKVPGLVGMLLAGVLVGPQAMNMLSPDLMQVSSDFRMVALVVILMRAGFELRRDTLYRVGTTVISMSCAPAIFEITAVTVLGPYLLGLSWLASAMLGCILGAVSPAVVVPLMIDFMDRGKGAERGLPTLILAACSVNAVFVIVLFSIALGAATSGGVNWAWQLAGIPLSILLGVASGLAAGLLLLGIFTRFSLEPTRQTMVLLGVAIWVMWLERAMRDILPFAGLLAVMSIGLIILDRKEALAHRISGQLKKLWISAELLLFVLVGAQVDLQVAWQAGLNGMLLISLGLAARCLGAYLCVAGTGFTRSERLFAVVAAIPKATVQAAIGSLPLAAGVAGGETILAVAALSILVTAPLGAAGIKTVGERVLT